MNRETRSKLIVAFLFSAAAGTFGVHMIDSRMAEANAHRELATLYQYDANLVMGDAAVTAALAERGGPKALHKAGCSGRRRVGPGVGVEVFR